MNLLTFIVTGMLALSLSYFIVLMLIRIRSDVITGQNYRQALQAEITALRIDRMMAALGINRQRYLHQQNTLEIHQHMQRCRECDNTETCDDKLGKQAVDKNTIDYCNNADVLKDIIEGQRDPGN